MFRMKNKDLQKFRFYLVEHGKNGKNIFIWLSIAFFVEYFHGVILSFSSQASRPLSNFHNLVNL